MNNKINNQYTNDETRTRTKTLLDYLTTTPLNLMTTPLIVTS